MPGILTSPLYSINPANIIKPKNIKELVESSSWIAEVKAKFSIEEDDKKTSDKK